MLPVLKFSIVCVFFSGKACKTVFTAASCKAEVQRRLEPQRETALLSQTRTVASGRWNKRGGDQGTCILFLVCTR